MYLLIIWSWERGPSHVFKTHCMWLSWTVRCSFWKQILEEWYKSLTWVAVRMIRTHLNYITSSNSYLFMESKLSTCSFHFVWHLLEQLKRAKTNNEKLVVLLCSTIFSHGHLYLALSRVSKFTYLILWHRESDTSCKASAVHNMIVRVVNPALKEAIRFSA